MPEAAEAELDHGPVVQDLGRRVGVVHRVLNKNKFTSNRTDRLRLPSPASDRYVTFTLCILCNYTTTAFFSLFLYDWMQYCIMYI